MTREQLIAQAEQLGIPRPRVLTQPELVDEIIGRTAKTDRERAKARGWLGRARDFLARVVERGLHLPEAARVLRPPKKDGEEWPAPPPPLPTVTLAEIYAAQGHLERAIAVLDEVIAREPEHREARAMRERFTEQSHRSRARTTRSGSQDGGAAPLRQPPSQTQTQPAPTPPPTPETGPKPAEAAPETIASAPAATEEQVVPTPAPATPPPVLETAAPVAEAPETPGSPLAEATPPPTVIVATVTGPEPALLEPVKSTKEVAPEVPAHLSEGLPPEPIEAVASRPATEPLDEPPLPDRYEVDEIVAIAVDPRTVYLYWEVRATTLAHARAEQPDGWLCVRIATVTASWEGPVVDTRDLHVDALYGDRFLRDLQPGSNVRVSVGWRNDDGFQPFAVGSEVTAPRAVPVDSIAQEVARWEAEPAGGSFPSRRVEAVSLASPLREARLAPSTGDEGGPPPPTPAQAAASAEAFAERARASGHGGPVDTGIAVWGSPPIEGALTPSTPGTEAYEEEYDEEPVAEDGPSWFEPGGSSELGHGGPTRRLRPSRGRRLVPGAPGAPGTLPPRPSVTGWWPAQPAGAPGPGVPDVMERLGGASDLFPGGASDLSY